MICSHQANWGRERPGRHHLVIRRNHVSSHLLYDEVVELLTDGGRLEALLLLLVARAQQRDDLHHAHHAEEPEDPPEPSRRLQLAQVRELLVEALRALVVTLRRAVLGVGCISGVPRRRSRVYLA